MCLSHPLSTGYRATHLVCGRVGLTLIWGVPRCCAAVLPVLTYFHLPKQDRADSGTCKTKSTQQSLKLGNIIALISAGHDTTNIVPKVWIRNELYQLEPILLEATQHCISCQESDDGQVEPALNEVEVAEEERDVEKHHDVAADHFGEVDADWLAALVAEAPGGAEVEVVPIRL